NEDGDITNKITTSGTVNTNKAGTYTITYSVTDSAGNSASVTRTVKVEKKPDTTKPTITLKGSNPITITEGDSFTDPGATASDNEDGDITNKITTSGTVNTNKAGTYTITYSVTDSAGNSASITRTVKVEKKKVENPYTNYYVAKDNFVHDAIKDFHGYVLKAMVDHDFGDQTSDDVYQVYGQISGFDDYFVLKLNHKYENGTKVVVQVFSQDGELLANSALKTIVENPDGDESINVGTIFIEE
ncbi:MAG: hypothetical protein DSZ06_02655, partial [Sulfurospirillum sp.]